MPNDFAGASRGDRATVFSKPLRLRVKFRGVRLGRADGDYAKNRAIVEAATAAFVRTKVRPKSLITRPCGIPQNFCSLDVRYKPTLVTAPLLRRFLSRSPRIELERNRFLAFSSSTPL